MSVAPAARGVALRRPPLRSSRAPARLLALLAPLVLAGSAAAQAPDSLRQDTVYDLEPIAVRAVRPSATTGGVSAVTVRLDSVRFRPAPLLEHVLRELPLVQVRTNSRGEAQLALRGAEERQIAILLDGVPLTLGWDHRTDLSVIPMTAARSIRLVRGMSSLLHGPNVLGGAVEIDLASGPAGRLRPFQAAAGMDDDGGYSVGLTGATSLPLDDARLVIRAGLGHRDRPGFDAPEDAEAVYPALGDGELRVNSDLEHSDGFLSARYETERGAWLSATTSAFTAQRGVPPELSETGPRLWRYPESSRLVAILSGGLGAVANELGVARLEVSAGADFGRTRIEDFIQPSSPASPEATADSFFARVGEAEDADDRTLTLRVEGRQTLPGGAALRAGATLADIRHDEVIHTYGSAGDGRAAGEYNQRLWSLATEAEVPFDLRVGPLSGGRVSGGLAYDGAATPEAGPDVQGSGPTVSEWGGRLGVSATTGGGGLMVHTAISRRGRFPALREMYSTALGRFHPNPELRPEILTAVEAGFTSRAGPYDLQVVGFHQRLDDAIARAAPPAGSDARYMRVNRDRIRSTGLEVLAGYTLDRLALETEFTVQDVEVVEPGLPGVRAEYEPAFAGGVGGSLPLFAGLEAGAEVEYWSEQYCSSPSPGRESYETLEPSTRTDVQLSRTFRLDRPVATFRRVGVELAVDNVTDSAVYDQCGLPQPGRTLRLQVRLD